MWSLMGEYEEGVFTASYVECRYVVWICTGQQFLLECWFLQVRTELIAHAARTLSHVKLNKMLCMRMKSNGEESGPGERKLR